MPTPPPPSSGFPLPTISSQEWDKWRVSHGVIIGFAILIFALSGIILRLSKSKYSVRVHYCTQIFATVMVLVGFGQGVWMANQGGMVWWKRNAGHEILGTILVPVVLATMFLGYIQHKFWKEHQKRSWRNDVHIWTARVVILLGIVDGLIPNIPPTIYFGVPAVLIVVLYLIVVVRWEVMRRRVEGDKGEGVQVQTAQVATETGETKPMDERKGAEALTGLA